MKPDNIRIRAIARFYQADERCGADIASNLGIDVGEILEEVKRQGEG
jgi:catalase